jgi:hypothetical protein
MHPAQTHFIDVDLSRPMPSLLPDSGLHEETAVPARSSEARVHRKSKSVAKVPTPHCHGAVKLRWLQFLLHVDLDPQVSRMFRAWIFWAAKQRQKEKQLARSLASCRAQLLQEHAVTAPPALSTREKRLLTAILASYSFNCGHGMNFPPSTLS